LNWFETHSVTGDSYSNLYFINSSTGFLSAKGILKTTDGGATWFQKMLWLLFFISLFPSASTGFAYAVFRFFQNRLGENWGELSSTDYSFFDMYFLNDNTGFLIGDQGMILKTTNGGGNFVIGIEPGSNFVPHTFELFQNYPNPFNPVTSIGYQIPEPGQVKIVIFDVLGRELQTLVNEFKPAGRYDVHWDAAMFSSGVYFYKISAGDFTRSRKLILIK
jgi:hypothetical protein